MDFNTDSFCRGFRGTIMHYVPCILEESISMALNNNESSNVISSEFKCRLGGELSTFSCFTEFTGKSIFCNLCMLCS